jgi:ligand-binding sensor domain-containing protein/signal transduction histidine kinase
MPFFPVLSPQPGSLSNSPGTGAGVVRLARDTWLKSKFLLLAGIAGLFSLPAPAVILWNDPGPTLVNTNGAGSDILGGAVKRDDSANDTLYFKFHVEPLSDKDTEAYFAGFELFEGDAERLGIGNSLEAWAYSAFFHASQAAESNNPDVYIDLHTAKPEPAASASYQYPRRGVGVTIVFKIQYVPGEDDLVTVWLNPDLGPGANEAYQPEVLTTRFNANASFDEIRLRHGGGGGGWRFSDLAIATSFTDFVDVSSARPNDAAASALGGVRAISFQSWQKEQGLPLAPVRALTQTHDGYLWLGSDDGLARFDGMRFTRFGLPEGFKVGPVSALLEDDSGALWIGTAGNGLQRWQNGTVTVLMTNNGLPDNSITALAKDATGWPWIGTEAGLVLWQDGKITPLAAAGPFERQTVTALQRDAQGTMWMGVNNLGVFEFTNNTFVPLPADGVGDLLKHVRGLLFDEGGKLWVSTGDDFVMCYEGDHWRRFRIPHQRGGASYGALAAGPDGAVWAGAGAGGLVQFKDGKSVTLPAGAGLAGRVVESLLADNEGRLWVGTDSVLNCLKRKSLFSLSQGNGLGFGAVHALAEPSPGVVWAAKPNDGLYRWDGKSFNRLSADNLSPHDSQITAMLVTHDGFCWVATTNSLLLYRDPIAVGDEVETIESAPRNIVALAEGRHGAVWAGTRDGQVHQLFENRWLAPADFVQTNAISCLAPGTDGAMWVGTDGNGLYRFYNGSHIRIGKKDGLSSDSIRSLYLDSQGTLWIGTADAGLARWREGHVSNFSVPEGLPDNTVSQILEDDSGRLWLGTGRGIACINKRRLDEVAAGQSPAVYAKLFGLADGMLAEECTGGFCPAGLRTKSGLLWFSTLKGLVVIDPQTVPAVTQPPKPMLEEVLVDDVAKRLPRWPLAGATSAADTLRVTPGKHHVEFRYTGLGFDQPELMRFRYQLEGLDTTWVDAGTRLSAFYSFLPPGEYKFRLAACNSDGLWNESHQPLELVVLRHFWQTWWFLVFGALSVLALVAGMVQAVVRRKMHRRLKLLEQERTLERERTRIAQDLHDEMGAKLCRISFLSEHARRGELPPDELRDQITSISDASREVLHSLDEIVWAVNPHNDTLEHVASYIGQYAQDYFNMTGIQCELAIPDQLPPHPLSSQQRHNLFLAAHEAFTNILKHSGATQARVSMAMDDGVFDIEIVDNGHGFDLAAARAGADSSADGLKNMSRRLDAIGGRCEIESAAGRGTRVKFIVFVKTLAKLFAAKPQ